MNSVTKLRPLFFVAVCLFWVGCSGVDFTNISNDGELSSAIKIYDSENTLIVLYFIDDNTASDNSIINSLASSHENIKVFKVNISKCKITCEDLGLEILPSAILRKFGRNKVTIMSPDLIELEDKVKKYKNTPEVENFWVQEIKEHKEFKSAYTLADLSDRMIVVHITKTNVNKVNFLRLTSPDDEIDILAKRYKNHVMVFKIDTALSQELEKVFSKRAQFLQDAYPKTLFRKSKKDIHWLLGYNYQVFYKILVKHNDSNKDESMELTIVDDNGNHVNAVRYAADYGDLKIRMHAAERDNKLILLYIVEKVEGKNVDSSVDMLAKSYPNIIVIKVDASKEVLDEYLDKGKTQIDCFPLFVVKKFKIIKEIIYGFNMKLLYKLIKKYRNANTDPDLPWERDVIRWIGLTYERYLQIMYGI